MIYNDSAYWRTGEQVGWYGQTSRPVTDPELAYPVDIGLLAGGFIERGIWHGVERSGGVVMSNDFFKTHIDDRIWLRQTEVDAGFIVEDADFDMEIWNTKNSDVSCTDINYVYSAAGLNLNAPATPFTVPKHGGTVDFTLTVLKEGDPTQDTTIEFTIDGNVYTSDVEATRVVSFLFEPNWLNKVQFELNFETVIAQTPRNVEQRRALSNVPKRVESFSVSESNYISESFFYSIQRGKDKIFGVPIFFEIFQLLNATAGQTILNTNGNIDKLWNLNNLCDFVLLLDVVSRTVEIKEITTVNVSSIVTANALVNTFDVNTTYCYSVFLGVVESVNFIAHTSQTDVGKIVFTEV